MAGPWERRRDHPGLWSEAFKTSISKLWASIQCPPIITLLRLPSIFSFLSDFQQSVSLHHRDFYLPGQGLPGVSCSQITEQYKYCFLAFLRSLVILIHLGCPKLICFTVNEIPARTKEYTPATFLVFYDDYRLLLTQVFVGSWLLTNILKGFIEGFAHILHSKSCVLHPIHSTKNLLLVQ